MHICTKLLRLPVCDPNGRFRESLASLIIRTARENDVSPGVLLDRSFRSDSHDGLKCTSRALGAAKGQSINGSGKHSQAYARKMEELTQLKNLQASTSLRFSPFMSINGGHRNILAWSPEFFSREKEPYHPLIWAFDAVRVCPREKKPLISLCQTCRKRLCVLSGSSRTVVCYRCGASLAEERIKSPAPDPVASEVKDIEYETWIANQVGDFVRFQVTESLPADFNYVANLRFWLDKFNLKPCGKHARLIGTTQAALGNWLREGAIPRMRMTLNLSWVFGVTLLDFLHRKVPENHDGKLRHSIDAGARQASVSIRRPIDRPRLEADLIAILSGNKYPMLPFAEICQRKLDRREIVVREIFPDLAKQISGRFKRNKKLLSEIQQQQFCATIATIARFLHDQGIVPNHKTLSPYITNPGRLRCNWAIEALKKIRIELGYEDTAYQLLLPI